MLKLGQKLTLDFSFQLLLVAPFSMVCSNLRQSLESRIIFKNVSNKRNIFRQSLDCYNNLEFCKALVHIPFTKSKAEPDI